MTFQDVLNTLISGSTAYATAKKLKVSPQTFYRWQNGQRSPSDEQLDKIIEMGNLPTSQVYLAAYAEKIHNAAAAAQFRELATQAA